MGCVFCASGIGGVVRNLSAAEIVEQLLHCDAMLPAQERISHIVVMGMGEPLANLEALLPALAWATSKQGLGLSARHITISTVGLVKKMRELAESGRPYHLAVSLHAPDDEVRRKIVPTAEKTPLSDILEAADEFRRVTGRQVTFEYVLLGDVNDQPHHAEALARLLRGRDAMINLIPYNPVSGLGYRTPNPARSRSFAEVLRSAGCVVKIRMRRGAGIAAACGQLRRSQMEMTTIQSR
jgi:23S rRNA (adenine2503-C2)-methyltransferase